MKIKGIEKDLCFVCDEREFSGVQKIALKVAKDIERVFGFEPTKSYNLAGIKKNAVIFGTLNKSYFINELAQAGKIDCSKIAGKREVFGSLWLFCA